MHSEQRQTTRNNGDIVVVVMMHRSRRLSCARTRFEWQPGAETLFGHMSIKQHKGNAHIPMGTNAGGLLVPTATLSEYGRQSSLGDARSHALCGCGAGGFGLLANGECCRLHEGVRNGRLPLGVVVVRGTQREVKVVLCVGGLRGK